MGTAQIAATFFLKLLKDVQEPSYKHITHPGTQTSAQRTLRSGQQEAAHEQHEQLYDPFEQHGGARRTQRISFDGFEPLRLGADSSEPPVLRRRWRFVGIPLRLVFMCSDNQGTCFVGYCLALE